LAAGPFAEIDEAAAIAAEGEVRVSVFDQLFADWAAEFDGSLARHTIRIVEERSLEKVSQG
jgi:hypothetical protein